MIAKGVLMRPQGLRPGVRTPFASPPCHATVNYAQSTPIISG